jgi:energy-coupling factor transporter ATP-binding protein EcfA2
MHVVVGLREPDEGVVSRPKDMRIGWLPQDVVDAVGESTTVLEHVLEGAQHILDLEARLRELEKRIEVAPRGAGAAARLLLAHPGPLRDPRGLRRSRPKRTACSPASGSHPGDAERPTTSCPAAGGSGSRWPGCCCPDRTCSCWTSRPTTSTSRPSPGSRRPWPSCPAGCCSSATTATSSTRSPTASSRSRPGTATEYTVRGGTTAAEQGGFASFVAQREERLTQLRAAKVQQDKVLAQTERFIERFRYKASKAKQVQSRIKALDKVDRIEIPDHRHLVASFQFPEPVRAGRVVAKLEGVSVSYGDNRCSTASTSRSSGAGRSLIGPNGAGKTTLLRLLASSLEPDEGRSSSATTWTSPSSTSTRPRSWTSPARCSRSSGPRSAPSTATQPPQHARGVRVPRRPRRSQGGRALRRGTHPAGARQGDGLAGQPAAARRADQPPRPRQPRRPRGRPGRLPRHRRADHPRPARDPGGRGRDRGGGGGAARWFDGTFEELLWRRDGGGPPVDRTAGPRGRRRRRRPRPGQAARGRASQRPPPRHQGPQATVDRLERELGAVEARWPR